MDQQTITDRRKAAESKLRQADRDREHALVDLRHVQADCEHPDARSITHMGESCKHCPDCDGCDV